MRQELEQRLRQHFPIMCSRLDHFECQEGWYQIIEDLFSVLQQAYENHLSWETYPTFDCVKEKFGGLRVYVNYYPKNLQGFITEQIDKAEKRSFETCEYCGCNKNSGKNPHVRNVNRYLIKTICDDCYEKQLFVYQ